LLVLGDLAGSAYLAARVRVPASIPDYALQADAVYRLEVGAVCFGVVYLAAIAFFLALDGRGFVELGTRGLKAQQVVKTSNDEQKMTLAWQIKIQRDLEQRLDRIDADLENTSESLDAQEDRLQSLERRR
jgi:hypothetical protein